LMKSPFLRHVDVKNKGIQLSIPKQSSFFLSMFYECY
jgi:hypothetical protein